MMRTLCIDIGGSGTKAIVVDLSGAPVGERARLETPRPATPGAVLEVIEKLVASLGDFDRISVGFPGVVKEGVVKTAPNLDPSWGGFPLAAELSSRFDDKPARVANDAAVQGLGVIEGRGFEVVITLGTGMGCSVYLDGHVGHVEMAHHPFRNKKTYEERVGNIARKKVGNKRWNKRVRQVIDQLEALFNYRQLYIGGGNVKHLDPEGLPENVKVVDNIAGLLGGIRLWQAPVLHHHEAQASKE